MMESTFNFAVGAVFLFPGSTFVTIGMIYT